MKIQKTKDILLFLFRIYFKFILLIYDAYIYIKKKIMSFANFSLLFILILLSIYILSIFLKLDFQLNMKTMWILELPKCLKYKLYIIYLLLLILDL